MIFEVELQAFGGGAIRRVEVPDSEVPPPDAVDLTLSRIFYYGQNCIQDQPRQSVSVGDVIRLYGKRHVVRPIGFHELGPEEESKGVLEYFEGPM